MYSPKNTHKIIYTSTFISKRRKCRRGRVYTGRFIYTEVLGAGGGEGKEVPPTVKGPPLKWSITRRRHLWDKNLCVVVRQP